MIFLGHVGTTVCAAQCLRRWVRPLREVDLRAMAFCAVLPDLIDKPLALLFPVTFGYHTRLFGHSLAFSFLVVLPALLALRRRLGLTTAAALALWLAELAHLAMDRLWEHDREWLFWPLLGTPPPLQPTSISLFFVGGFHPWVLVSEAVGAALLLLTFVMVSRAKKTPLS